MPSPAPRTDQARDPYLFQRFPLLRGRLPWTPLGRLPTPVAALDGLGARLGHDRLFVKRDDLSGERYGGNKIRKLEFTLGDALAKGHRTVLTVGAAGSNHVLATTLCARALGMRTVGVMVPQAVQAYVRRNLLANQAAGCLLVDAAGSAGAVRAARAFLEACVADGRPPYVLPPGGSSPRGVLGYVEAAFELAAQVAAGVLPEPDFVFVPVGTCGTLAGLVAGCRLAGLRSVPVGVRVVWRASANERVTAFLANRTLRHLRRLDASVPRVPRVRPDDVTIRHGYFGRGYAHFTREGVAATEIAAAWDGLLLEGCYTGKAMAGFLDIMGQPGMRRRVGVFVDTHNSRPTAPLTRGAAGPAQLPPGLRAYFEREDAPVV